MKTIGNLLILLLFIEVYVEASKLYSSPNPQLLKDAASGNTKKFKSLHRKFNIKTDAVRAARLKAKNTLEAGKEGP